MTFLAAVNQILVIVGIPTLLAWAVYLGRKLEVLDNLTKVVNEEVRPDLKDVRERLFVLEGKTANIFQTTSPVQLINRGEEFLHKTGLDAYIDNHFDEFVSICAEQLKTKTAYDVQATVFEYFGEVSLDESFENELKEAAYQEGISMDVARRIGAIYLRDRMLEHMNIDHSDIDVTREATI